MIVSSSTRFSPRVPSPLPVFAVTVHVVPLPLTPVTCGVVTPPPAASWKSVASTPVTASLKVTVQETLVAFDGVEPTRLIELTVGGVLSIVSDLLPVEPVLPAVSDCVALNVDAPAAEIAVVRFAVQAPLTHGVEPLCAPFPVIV